MKPLKRTLWIVVLTLLAPGCGYFMVKKDQLKETKSIAVIQFIGEPEKEAFEDGPGRGRETRLKIVTNDAIALRDFLTSRGHKVIPFTEMVKSEKYSGSGDYVRDKYSTPEGMRLFTGSSPHQIEGADLGFMGANEAATGLGVDAVIVVYTRWKQESVKMGLQTLARTSVRMQMVDRRSNVIWRDLDFADSEKTIESAAGFSQANQDDFVTAYNQAFATALGKMKQRLDEALAK